MLLRMQLKHEDLMGIHERRIDFMKQKLMAVGEAHNGTAKKIPCCNVLEMITFIVIEFNDCILNIFQHISGQSFCS